MGDQERDRTLALLAGALSEGRLETAEHAERARLALQARTRDELDTLTADLPAPAPDQRERDREDWRDWLAEWRYWLGGAFVMNAIWGVHSLSKGELTHYWPLIPLGIWAAVLIAALLLPSKDEDAGTTRDGSPREDR